MESLVEELKFTTITDVVESSCWLKKIDDNFKEIHEKLTMVVRTAECPEEYLQLFEEIVKNIQAIVQDAFHNFTIRASGFGSFVTGLTLKNCDLDVFIEFQPDVETTSTVLKRIKKFLYSKKLNMFSRIIFIPAKVPILKCEHILNFGCDISVDNAMARHNSQLIKYYLSLNDRYRDYFLLIKLWSKRCGCSSFTGFKSYTIVLMVIFYLQQRELAPSVEQLQSSVPARLVKGWNTSFPSCVERIDRNLDLLDLICGFFKYYATYEFGLYVISPYSGKSVLKCEEWKKHLGEKSTEMKSDGFACVQDVFEHTFNTSSSVSKQAIVDFQTYCAASAQQCESSDIRVEKIFLTIPREKKKKRKNFSLNYRRSFMLCVAGTLEGHTEEELRNFWVTSTVTKVKYVLTEAVLGTVVEESDGQIFCKLSHMVSNWQLRTQVLKTLEGEDKKFQSLSLLERCVATSSNLKLLPEAMLAQPFEFVIRYEVTCHPTRFILSVHDPGRENEEAPSYQVQEITGLFFKFLPYIYN